VEEIRFVHLDGKARAAYSREHGTRKKKKRIASLGRSFVGETPS